MAKLKTFLINIIVFGVSVCICLVLCEFASRFFLNASDFLSLEVVNDPILGWVPSPSAMAGFDKWGFRNRKVPESSEIVAVGDSHTYGNTARMVDSWPYVVARETGRPVYNMGLGGYGPNQYYFLSKTKALQLKPKVLLWGLYMGDDFDNAFQITYGLDYWKGLRELPPQKVDANITELPATDTGIRRMRVWLSRHSVMYQLVFHSGFGGRVTGEVQIRNASQLYPGYATSLILPEKNILEAFRPRILLSGLDQLDPRVREGMRITFKLMKEMNDICRQNQIQFVVVVIPTKEMVFSEYLEHDPKLPLGDVIDKLLQNERLAEAGTFKFLADNSISVVYPLPALKKSIGEGLYARTANDMHPNRNGYRVIGQSVAEYLKQPHAELPPGAPAR
jgi:hypothetical protein